MTDRDRRFTDWGDPGAVTVSRAARFPLGQIVATPAAIDALDRSGDDAATFLQRHLAGDWGGVPPEDAATNEIALTDGDRVLSAYGPSGGGRVWVITEGDRSATTLLLPEDY